jgi:hypothetical protein
MIDVGSILQCAAIATAVIGGGMYVIKKCSRIDSNQDSSQSKKNVSDIFKRHSENTRGALERSEAPVKPILQTEVAKKRDRNALAEGREKNTIKVKPKGGKKKLKESHDTELPKQAPTHFERLVEQVYSAFNAMSKEEQSFDLMEYFKSRKIDFDISKESGKIETVGLFLIDFYDEMRRKINFVDENDGQNLTLMADKISHAMETYGFELVNLPNYDRSKQRILSVERSQSVEGIKLVATEETGLVFNGRILRKQGISIITNEN